MNLLLEGNTAKCKNIDELKKEFPEYDKLLKEYGPDWIVSMPFSNFENDEESFEYQFPQIADLFKQLYVNVEEITQEQYDNNDTDAMDAVWDNYGKFPGKAYTDCNTIKDIAEYMYKDAKHPIQFDKIIERHSKNKVLGSDKDIVAKREVDNEFNDDEFSNSLDDLDDSAAYTDNNFDDDDLDESQLNENDADFIYRISELLDEENIEHDARPEAKKIYLYSGVDLDRAADIVAEVVGDQFEVDTEEGSITLVGKDVVYDPEFDYEDDDINEGILLVDKDGTEHQYTNTLEPVDDKLEEDLPETNVPFGEWEFDYLPDDDVTNL